MGVAKRIFQPGQTLFSEGGLPDSMYIIVRGAISIQKNQANGRALELAKLQSGEILGELSFFDQQPRSATAVALVETETLEIPFSDMEQIYRALPSYMKTIIASMAERLRRANEQHQKLLAAR